MERRQQERGQPLEELVKGSMDYTMHLIRRAWYAQFGRAYEGEGAVYAWIEEIFADHVIAKDDQLAADEFYYVPYERQGETYVFADRGAWEVVELGYQPQSRLEESVSQRQKFTEVVDHAVSLAESQEGGRWIEGTGITADVVNGNGRRYPRHVLREAVERLQSHLHESAGQGRLGQLTGEAEHPVSKGALHPQFLETIVNWNAGYVRFDEGTGRVAVRGRILETSKGKDAIVIMEGGVMPGLSMRGYGTSITVKEDRLSIEEVTHLTITGFDLLSPGMNSDPNGSVTVLESRAPIQVQEEEDMDLNLTELRKQYPHLVEQIEEEHDAKKKAELEEALRRKAEEDQRVQKALEEREAQLRKELGVPEGQDLQEALRQRDARLQALEASRRAAEVSAFIEAQVAELAYPEFLRAQFVEAVRAAKPETQEAVKQLVEAKRAEYDAIMAALTLQSRGRGVQVLGPTLELQTGVPAFARVGFELQESLVRAGEGRAWNPNAPVSVNEQFAASYLALYDKQNQRQLLAETRAFEEAEQSTDLSLPYSVVRAVIAEAFPELVATSVFDFGMMAGSTDKLWYEKYEGETGYSVDVTSEAVTADEGAWVALAYKRITPGTVVITSSPAGTTYVEGSDYVIDYANGKIMTLDGDIADGASLLANYSYTAIRKGEMAAIERGKMTLETKTITAVADRLATQISNEAVVFSRSQLGYDATTKTLGSLVKQIRRKIDQGILYLALSSALQVASNSGGTWTAATDALDLLTQYLGQAKVKVVNRYYEPNAILASATNMDRLSNWDGFKRDGFPDAVLNATGFVGRVKGLPAFASTEFSDGYFLVVNRELVMHRVYQTMQLKGPYPSYDVSGGTSKIIAADQFYAEEYNATEAPVPEKGSYVKVA